VKIHFDVLVGGRDYVKFRRFAKIDLQNFRKMYRLT